MLRGDDVADLQHRLNALGFDAGREDGIFGPDTSRALQDFQRNAGLAPDGIGGPEAVEALLRLGGWRPARWPRCASVSRCAARAGSGE